MRNQESICSALGLKRNPFPPTPDAASYFFTAKLQEQFTEIKHCIESQKGFVLVTGEVGLGKSTLVRRLLDALPSEEVNSALVFNTFLQEAGLLSAVLTDFGLETSGQIDADLSAFNQFLLAQHRLGKINLLIIDDAQNLTVKSLELVRLLCNLETDQEKLLQILLVGQPELAEIISSNDLRQLKSRIVQHVRLSGLSAPEVVRYVEFRITSAGGEGRISLAPAAARHLHKLTHGNTRLMHLILDRCLYGLVAQRQNTIDLKLLRAAGAETQPTAKRRLSFFGLRFALASVCAVVGSLAYVGFMQSAQGAKWVGSWSAMASSGAQPVADKPAPTSLTTASASHVSMSKEQLADNAAQPLKGSTQACLSALRAHPDGQTLVTQQLPKAATSRLRANTATCVEVQTYQTWVTWLVFPDLAAARANGQGPAVRQVQQNLSRLGWL